MSECCKEGFAWDGTPSGRETKVAGLNTYLASSKGSKTVILMIHDVWGWTFNNLRLLADRYSKDLNADVYLPDFFGGEVIIDQLEDETKRKSFDLGAFIMGRNGKETRWPEIKRVVEELKKQCTIIGAIGFCYGGWGVLKLADSSEPTVNFIATAHPSLLTPEEIKGVTVPVLYLAPEHDPQFTDDLKALAKENLPAGSKYLDFPGLKHGFAVRGDPTSPSQRAGFENAMSQFIAFASSKI